MTEKQAKQIFEKYNPQDAVVRCPAGRAPVRKLLDLYAKAAVNLYGIISIKDFVDIFNSQNAEQTSEDEVFVLLLPDILKKNKTRDGGYYSFYKNCIMVYWAVNDFDFAEFWLREQENKSRFIPDKNELLKYEYAFYEDKIQHLHWEKVEEFLLKEIPSINIYRICDELRDISRIYGRLGIKEVQEKYDIFYSSQDQIQKFLKLLGNAHNNTRMWINKGHSPEELFAK